MKSRRISKQPTYKPRSYMIQHNKSHVTSQFTSISHTSEFTQLLQTRFKQRKESSLTSTSHLVQIHASTMVISSKSRIERITEEYHAPWFSPHPRQDEGSSYSTHDTSCHLQQEGINPEYENILSQTYPSETKTNDTKDQAQLNLVDLADTFFLRKSISNNDQLLT